MTTAIYHHSDCWQHDTRVGHPECAARLDAIINALKTPEFASLVWREAPLATDAQLKLIHSQAHLDHVFNAIPQQGYAGIDGDTVVSPGSAAAARRSAGAGCAALDAIMAKEITNAFCVLRPPGHHAEPEQVMGFCLFSNAAIVAAYARKKYEIQRVAVVDFDVHHGNGTQAALQNDAHYLYVSIHQSPLYPGTGAKYEKGVAENVLNIPLVPHSGSAEIRHAFTQQIIPKIRLFEPELLVISAGFDAHYLDPLANLNLHESDFNWMTKKLSELAQQFAQNRLISLLEGGYNLEVLGSCAASHVRALLMEQ